MAQIQKKEGFARTLPDQPRALAHSLGDEHPFDGFKLEKLGTQLQIHWGISHEGCQHLNSIGGSSGMHVYENIG